MQYWLMKSEPDVYSIDTLKKDTITAWSGVRNYQVRNMMRDEMKVGDKVVFYHSSAGKETGAAGEARVATLAHRDKTQFDSKSEYFDTKSTEENPRWWCVDVEYVRKFKRLVTLEEMKAETVFTDSRLTQKGNRLSVVPLTKSQFNKIVVLGQK